MGPIDARASGQFKIGDTTINRLGYGAMRLTGPGIWGAPSDRGAALATLRRLHEIGVNFIDTADQANLDMWVAYNHGLDTAEPRTPQSTTPTSFRQSCDEVLEPRVMA